MGGGERGSPDPPRFAPICRLGAGPSAACVGWVLGGRSCCLLGAILAALLGGRAAQQLCAQRRPPSEGVKLFGFPVSCGATRPG